MSNLVIADPPLLTLGDIARRLNASSHRVKYAIEQYHIAPRMRAGIIRLWLEEDIARVASALARIASNRGERA